MTTQDEQVRRPAPLALLFTGATIQDSTIQGFADQGFAIDSRSVISDQ
jgi:hypothetical protein